MKTRRQFLNDTFDIATQMMMASLSLKLGMGSKLARAAAPAGPKQRRHLINITGGGGWESMYFHLGITSPDYLGLADGIVKTGLTAYTPRYLDNQAAPVGTNGQSVGPGLAVLLKNFAASGTSDAPFNTGLSDLLIWRGMTTTEAHGISLHMILEGALSSYSASFSSIVAQQLAQTPDYARPLHYAQIAETPGSLAMQTGFLTGYAIPVNIPDPTAWSNLTNSAGNATPGSMLALQEAAIQNLNAIASKKSRSVASSQEIMAGYGGSFDGFIKVAGSQWASSPEFLAIQARYVKALNDQLGLALPQFFTPTRSGLTTPDMQKYSTMTSTVNSLSTYILNRQGTVANWVSRLSYVAFSYAMAEFLIKKDLSAVVDIASPMADCHSELRDGVAAGLITYVCFLELVNALKNTDAGMGDGSSVLDHTLVVLNTEFDREIMPSFPGSVSPVVSPGNGHGYTTSVVMAGYGIRRGVVVGDSKTARHDATFPSIGYWQPLPIGSDGQPMAGGTVYNPQSILPTVCAIFGASVPSQQISTDGICQAVMLHPIADPVNRSG